LKLQWELEAQSAACKSCRLKGRNWKNKWADWCSKTNSPDCQRELDAAPGIKLASSHLTESSWEVLRLWERIQTQWRWAGMGGRAGLDYASVGMVASLIGVELDDYALGLLQIVEAERIKAWAEEEKKREADKKASSWEAPDQAGNTGESAFRKIKYPASSED
jgi:hypothetical protein